MATNERLLNTGESPRTSNDAIAAFMATPRAPVQPAIAAPLNTGESPRTASDSAAAFMAPPKLQEQPAINRLLNTGASPRTASDAAAAYINPPAAVAPPSGLPGRGRGVSVTRQPVSVSGEFSPRTVDDGTAAYLASPTAAAQVNRGGIPAALRVAPLDDAADAFRNAPNAAMGTGAAIREAVVGTASRAMGRVADAGNAIIEAGAPARSAITDFVKGIVGMRSEGAAPDAVATPAPARKAPAKVAAVPAANGNAAVPPSGPQPGTVSGTLTDPGLASSRQGNNITITGDGGPPATRTMQTQEGRRAQLAAAYAPTVYTEAPAAAVDPTKQIMAMNNDGTWSGMINARRLAKRVDADRAAAVANAGAETARMNAGTQQFNAETAAGRAEAEKAMIGENIKASILAQRGGALALKSKEEEAALRTAAASGDEKAIAKLRNLAAASRGKNPAQEEGEKMVELYMKSVAEYNKDPMNAGKPAPTFGEFSASLPPELFPSVKRGKGLPEGMKRQVGTSNGVPVYEDAQGKRYTAGTGAVPAR